MSSNKRVIIVILFSFFLYGCVQLQNNNEFDKNLLKKKFTYKEYAYEDKFIMFALEYNKIGKKEEARELFLKLYNETSKDEYLLEYIKNSFFLKKEEQIISIVEKNLSRIDEYKNRILKIYILALARNKELEKAEKYAQELIEAEKKDVNYELLGTILLQKEEFVKAKKLFKKAYKSSFSLSSILNLTNVMYVYLDEKKEAITLLEEYIEKNGCDNLSCAKLLAFYQEEKNIDGVISVLKRTYFNLKKKETPTVTLNRVYKLLMYYLEKKDINKAIEFLKTSHHDDDKLLDLYKNSLQYKEALKLANKLYEKSSNIDYLAQIAIIEFESAGDKKKALPSVIEKFENVLSVLDNHIYQNYLGYILIDFDIDVEKGISYVKKALEKDPNNIAYLDSLAWGQYKLKECKKAYENMKKVVDRTGLVDEEIKAHWEKIKECNK